MSLRELARQLGVSPSFVSQLENGKSQPSVATLYSLAQLLDLSIDGLFDGRSVHTSSARADPAAAGADAKTGDRRQDEPENDQADEDGAGARLGAPISRSQLPTPAEAWQADRRAVRVSVTDPGARPRLVMDSGVIWEQLARNGDQHIDFMEIVYPAGSSSTNDDRMLRHDGYEYGILLGGELQITYAFEVFTLRAGQAIALDSSVPHLFKNLGTVPARGIWFVHHRH